MPRDEAQFDYILAGGGLQAGLLVLAIRHHQPKARILVVERGAVFGGNHTWSFHRRDISSVTAQWLSPLPTYNWDSYQVRFPGYESTVDLEYATTTAEMMAGAVSQCLSEDEQNGSRVLLNTEVTDIQPGSITTNGDEQFRARCVLDCRGRQGPPTADQSSAQPVCGYQKFYGLEIELAEDWPSHVPMLMDACVDQSDGFHFIYVLPFSRRRVLIEDTWFSNLPQLDLDLSARQLRTYISGHTQSKWDVVRSERGCLPMPLRGFSPRPASENTSPALLAGGYAGGWFHAATGYSFPLAAQFANTVAETAPELAQKAIDSLLQENKFRFGFARFLNHLLFRLVSPQSRWQIFRRLYKSVPQETLSRFYAHGFSVADAARMVIGVPPRGLTPLTFLRGIRDDRRNSSTRPLETSA